MTCAASPSSVTRPDGASGRSPARGTFTRLV
jgi:hypothetical protein